MTTLYSDTTLLLDMDCVLADFVEGAANVWNLTFAQLQPHWVGGEYGIVEPLSRALEQEDFTEQDFWFKLDNQEAFWYNLKPTPWVDYLLHLASQFKSWYIVSDPSDRDHVITEKRHWLRRYLGHTDIFIPTAHKQLLARPDTLLIDDHIGHCNRFCARGGRSILFPAWHNPLYLHYEDPITYVEEHL